MNVEEELLSWEKLQLPIVYNSFDVLLNLLCFFKKLLLLLLLAVVVIIIIAASVFQETVLWLSFLVIPLSDLDIEINALYWLSIIN